MWIHLLSTSVPWPEFICASCEVEPPGLSFQLTIKSHLPRGYVEVVSSTFHPWLSGGTRNWTLKDAADFGFNWIRMWKLQGPSKWPVLSLMAKMNCLPLSGASHPLVLNFGLLFLGCFFLKVLISNGICVRHRCYESLPLMPWAKEDTDLAI